ncbi:MAG: replication protein [Gammaproteobacteria bacterium SHHR-1]
MASPQLEDGYTRIANELLEALLLADLSKRELLVLLAVIRKTYGFNRSMDRISSAQLAAATGLTATHCRATVRDLKARGLLASEGDMLGLQKDHDRWQGGPKQAGPFQAGPKQAGPKQAEKEAQNGPLGRPKMGLTKESIKNKKTPPPQEPPPQPDPVSGGGEDLDLIYPPALDSLERETAAILVSPVAEQAQALLDELDALIRADRIKVTRMACLRGLVKRAHAGTFTPEAGLAIKAKRDAQAKQAQRQQAQAQTASTDAVLARHAKLMGLSLDEYRQRLGGQA